MEAIINKFIMDTKSMTKEEIIIMVTRKLNKRDEKKIKCDCCNDKYHKIDMVMGSCGNCDKKNLCKGCTQWSKREKEFFCSDCFDDIPLYNWEDFDLRKGTFLKK